MNKVTVNQLAVNVCLKDDWAELAKMRYSQCLGIDKLLLSIICLDAIEKKCLLDTYEFSKEYSQVMSYSELNSQFIKIVNGDSHDKIFIACIYNLCSMGLILQVQRNTFKEDAFAITHLGIEVIKLIENGGIENGKNY